MDERNYVQDNEISLFELFAVLWKRRYLILIGTILFALLAITFFKLSKKIYSVDMVIRPAVSGYDLKNQKPTFFYSPDETYALIEAGTFDETLVSFLKNLRADYSETDTIELNISRPEKSDLIKISYETSNSADGVALLNQLADTMRDYHQGLLKLRQDWFDQNIIRLKENLLVVNQVRSLGKDLVLDRTNTMAYQSLKDKVGEVSTEKEEIWMAMLLESKAEDMGANLNSLAYLEGRKADLEEKLTDLLFEKEHVGNISIIRQPQPGKIPVKPKLVIIPLALVLGFFSMIFLAFVLEALSKLETEKKLPSREDFNNESIRN